jgi:hypothetical protein
MKKPLQGSGWQGVAAVGQRNLLSGTVFSGPGRLDR